VHRRDLLGGLLHEYSDELHERLTHPHKSKVACGTLEATFDSVGSFGPGSQPPSAAGAGWPRLLRAMLASAKVRSSSSGVHRWVAACSGQQLHVCGLEVAEVGEVSVAMKKSPLVARYRSPLVAR